MTSDRGAVAITEDGHTTILPSENLEGRTVTVDLDGRTVAVPTDFGTGFSETHDADGDVIVEPNGYGLSVDQSKGLVVLGFAGTFIAGVVSQTATHPMTDAAWLLLMLFSAAAVWYGGRSYYASYRPRYVEVDDGE